MCEVRSQYLPMTHILSPIWKIKVELHPFSISCVTLWMCEHTLTPPSMANKESRNHLKADWQLLRLRSHFMLKWTKSDFFVSPIWLLHQSVNIFSYEIWDTFIFVVMLAVRLEWMSLPCTYFICVVSAPHRQVKTNMLPSCSHFHLHHLYFLPTATIILDMDAC